METAQATAAGATTASSKPANATGGSASEPAGPQGLDISSLSPELARKWVGLRMAHEAAMVQDTTANLKEQRETVRRHNRMHLGGRPGVGEHGADENGADEDDEMGIVLGDYVTTVNQPAAAAPQVTSQPPAAPQRPGTPTWAKLAMAGLAAAGLGIPATAAALVAPSVIEAFNRPEPVAAVSQTSPSSVQSSEVSPAVPAARVETPSYEDTLYDLRLGSPD